MNTLTNMIQVNIPYTMLCQSYLDRFITHRLNPEIGFDADALDHCSLSDVNIVARRLCDCGLTITLHAPFIDLSPGSPDPEVRRLTQKRIEQVVRLIPFFKPKTVVCHAGYDHKRYWHMKDLWLENSMKTWSWLAKRISEEGSRLMLENVYEQHPHDMLPLFENLRGYGVGFCLDTGHHAVFSLTPMERWIETLGPYLGQLHLHDNSGEKDEHLALGRGQIDFRQLFGELMAINTERPVVTLEPHREEELWPSLKYLESIWPW
ncbi:MAG: sugar phosphate isomerase/epimerase [Proteobacteria bacterium]|nr:sugar phosphate isomerase/epimerase [Desulfobacteraceae bacterium]MBU0736144.1 sugar phosphate isomerase/epimerase [Pseudomonadota bacterium]MBU1902141.1 sugar phosphate isomerase/epimerase [Pseudomonadota bacterium]